MNEEQKKACLHLIRHSLGLDNGKEEYRNYYADSLVNADPNLDLLVTMGLMTRAYVSSACAPELQFYHVTDAGKKWFRENSAAPKALSRDKRRYRRWLAVRDSYKNVSFRDFLMLDEFREARESC